MRSGYSGAWRHKDIVERAAPGRLPLSSLDPVGQRRAKGPLRLGPVNQGIGRFPTTVEYRGSAIVGRGIKVASQDLESWGRLLTILAAIKPGVQGAHLLLP